MQLIDDSGAADVLGKPYIFLRIEFPNHTAIGPFRMGVLEAIHRCGSISEAAKARGVTYRMAWNVVKYLNAMFDAPLVLKKRGRRGGVLLTERGRAVLSLYRESERITGSAIAKQVGALEKLKLRTRERS